MRAEREISIEEESDEPPINEYDNNELHNELINKQKKYLSKTGKMGRGSGGSSAIKYTLNYLIIV